MSTQTDWSYKATVAQIAAHKPGVQFFRELIDTSSFKCYGTQRLTAEEAQAAQARFVGYYGRQECEFTAPFDIQRGHKIVTVKASKRTPVRCWEHIYGEL
jgi:hypothetical protein